MRSDGAFSPRHRRTGMWSSWYTVVGVTADIRNGQGLTDEPDPEIYVVARRGAWLTLGRLSLRTTARPADAEAFLRQSPPTSTRRSS